MSVLPVLHVGAPTQAGPLSVFPIWTDAPVTSPRPYTLTLRAGAAVSELPDGPAVNHLAVTNPGTKPLLLLEGTLLDGGWQHRTLVRDVLVAAGESRTLEVMCVEQGRWHGAGAQRLGRATAPLAVRGALRGIRCEDWNASARGADQHDVWARVQRYERAHGASATGSLIDVLERTASLVGPVVAGVRPLFGQRGVLLGVAGHPVLLEVFDHPRTLAEQWSAILTAVALDAIGAPYAPTPGYRARAFTARIQAMGLEAVAQEPLAVTRAGRDDLAAVRALTTPAGVIHAAALNVRHDLVLAA